MIRPILTIVLLVFVLAPAGARAQDDAAKVDSEQAVREQAFEKQLSGAALVGHFSVDGQPADKSPDPERYEIAKIAKAKDGYWIFNARIKYGKTDLTVPLMLKVLWAGDTPMISLTDFKIPGMDVYSARVIFHGDRYAGTWQHGKVGGHLWGKIEAKGAGEKKAEADSTK